MTDSLEATEGASVVLACTADASPVALLTWAQGAAVLAEEPGTHLELQLYNVTPAHDGIYTCVAENVHGRANRSLGLTVFCECPCAQAPGFSAGWGLEWGG